MYVVTTSGPLVGEKYTIDGWYIYMRFLRFLRICTIRFVNCGESFLTKMKNIGGSKSGMSKEMMNVIILTVVVWYTTQIAASLMMKKVMKRTIISPIDMTLSNLAISCSLDYIYVRFLAGSRLPTMSKSFSVKILPIAASLLLVKALTLMGYEYITISLAHTIKSCEPSVMLQTVDVPACTVQGTMERCGLPGSKSAIP